MRVCGLCPPDEDSGENRVSPIELLSTLAFLSLCMLYSLQISKLTFSGKKVVQMPQSLKSMGARCVTSSAGGQRFGQMPVP